jgi:hypothetical protein
MRVCFATGLLLHEFRDLVFASCEWRDEVLFALFCSSLQSLLGSCFSLRVIFLRSECFDTEKSAQSVLFINTDETCELLPLLFICAT